MISTGLLTSPSMVSFQASASPAGSGSWPLLRMKNFERRRGVVVEQLLGRLGHQRLVAEHDQAAVLAGEAELLWALRRGGGRRILLGFLREGGRDQPARHRVREHDRAADRGAHGGEAGAVEKSAPGYVRPAPERQRIGALGIVGVKLLDMPFRLHPVPPVGACSWSPLASIMREGRGRLNGALRGGSHACAPAMLGGTLAARCNKPLGGPFERQTFGRQDSPGDGRLPQHRPRHRAQARRRRGRHRRQHAAGRPGRRARGRRDQGPGAQEPGAGQRHRRPGRRRPHGRRSQRGARADRHTRVQRLEPRPGRPFSR